MFKIISALLCSISCPFEYVHLTFYSKDFIFLMCARTLCDYLKCLEILQKCLCSGFIYFMNTGFIFMTIEIKNLARFLLKRKPVIVMNFPLLFKIASNAYYRNRLRFCSTRTGSIKEFNFSSMNSILEITQIAQNYNSAIIFKF